MLGALLGFTLLVTTFLLRDVLGTVFFAITVAYVLYPVRERLVSRGLGPHVASALAATLAFVVVLLLLVPLALTLYLRRSEMFALLSQLPDRVPVTVGELTFTVDVAALVVEASAFLRDVAVAVAGAAPVLALKAMLFVFVLYALLLHPLAAGRALRRLVPAEYHDVLLAIHRRVKTTLYAIYVLQAATAFATFLIALVVFSLLGYRSAFSLAVVCGILQFIPILGPSLLILGLAAFDVALGDPTRGTLVLVLGLPLIGFLPDATVRPKLAERTAELPGSVYFVGFTGGVLSVGAIGFIAGPLAVAVLVEVVGLLSE